MSKKFSEIDEEEKLNIRDELQSAAIGIKMDYYEVSIPNKLLKDKIGICFNCKNLNYCKTEFDSIYAFCNLYEIRLNGQNRMVECNSHSPLGMLTLQEMYSIAYIIEPEEPKIEGFISTNPKLKK